MCILMNMWKEKQMPGWISECGNGSRCAACIFTTFL
jgi:hypothetical protein